MRCSRCGFGHSVSADESPSSSRYRHEIRVSDRAVLADIETSISSSADTRTPSVASMIFQKIREITNTKAPTPSTPTNCL